MSLIKRYKTVKNRINKSKINSQRQDNINLLAVSKKHTIESINTVYNLGQRQFGESYVQEAIQKIEQLSNLSIEWHFIGPIQSNKTKYLAHFFDWVQSVDSLKIIERLNRQRKAEQKPLNILLQLHVGGEQSKRGFTENELLSICKQAQNYSKLTIRGLMSIPAPTDNYAEQVKQFKSCQLVFKNMQKYLPVDTLSLGMSSDLEAAIECGSTMVRIGTDIFGNRGF